MLKCERNKEELKNFGCGQLPEKAPLNLENNEGSDGESTDTKEELAETGLQVIEGVSTKIPSERRKRKRKHKRTPQEIRQEEINHFRNKNRIHVWGSDIPEPCDNFEKLKEEYGVSETIVTNLITQGYMSPTPIQMQAWPILLRSRDFLGCAPTGSGKTAAFLVPILHHLKGPQKKGFRAVVVSPTRELAKQIHRECTRLSEGLGLRVHIINNVNKAKEKFGQQSAQKFDVLITTPNRLVHLLQEENPSISLSNVEWLVVDESDRLFETGIKGFRDQLSVIYQACSSSNIRRALFSATFAYEVEQWCKLNLNDVAMVSIGARNTTSDDVEQELIYTGNESGKLLALRDIFRKGYEPPVLIFVQTKDRAKELFRELIYDNIMVDVIHADRTQLQRDNVVKAFRERKIWVLICTELMARGIDFKGVNLVINYDFPPSTISYIHRVGRTGRAQHKGRALTFWTMEDKPYLRRVAQVVKNSGCEVPDWMLTLKKVTKKEKVELAKKHPDRGHVSSSIVRENYLHKRHKRMVAKSKKLKKQKKLGAKKTTEESETTAVEN
ncbi:DExD-box helicase 52 isoform X2 [Oratosquilla oratoria]|uniref:DExD-box helicase 52 isoform X2 n=1 Tax=Oratosquilla oratoria TaxID=337810 RepID=UPI003F75C73A